MKNVLFVLLLVIPMTFSFSTLEAPLDGDCGAPANVHVTNQSAGVISFDWDDVSGATGYQTWYVKQGGNSSSPSVESASNCTFWNLTAGTYDFYFQTVCDGEVSEIIVVEDLLMI
jgi:hypothetical protein